MPRKRKNRRNTPGTSTSTKRPNSNPDDTAEPTAVMGDQVAKRPRMKGGNVDEVQRKSMPPKKVLCNLSTQKFSAIVNYETFVDKTLFIKTFLEQNHGVVALFAPRRFGKSTLLNMLMEFLSGNKELFEKNKLKICKEQSEFFEEYCKKKPILYLDFKIISGGTVDVILEKLKILISEAFLVHRYLIKEFEGKYSWSNPDLNEEFKKVMTIGKFLQYCEDAYTLTEGDITIGFKKLSHLLDVYHNEPVYVLIDEYDHPIMELLVESDLGEEGLRRIMLIIGSLMSNLFKNNKHLKKGLIMGCVRIAQVLSGDANNIIYYPFLRDPDFSPYFGFTAEEVDSLLDKDEFKPFKTDQVKEWYNGYTVTDLKKNPPAIYSCISVLEYLEKSKKWNEPQFDKYWVETGSINDLIKFFAQPKILDLIVRLIKKEEVEIRRIAKFDKNHIFTLLSFVRHKPKEVDTEEAHLFIQFLAENGYLNVLSCNVGNATCIVRSPNMEINLLLRERCYNASLLKENFQLSPANTKNYLDALNSLLKNRNKNAFITFAKSVSQLFDGAVMPVNENELHCILFTLAFDCKKFVVNSELGVKQQKQRGKPPTLDIIVILNFVGMIIELKFEAVSSKAAYDQIIEKKYVRAFNNYKDVKVKILMGLHMTSERKVSLTYSFGKSSVETVTNEMSV